MIPLLWGKHLTAQQYNQLLSIAQKDEAKGTNKKELIALLTTVCFAQSPLQLVCACGARRA